MGNLPKESQSKEEILIDTVQSIWINGVLEDALNLNYQFPLEAKFYDGINEQMLSNTREVIGQIFDDVNRKFLILGAPASGKTVLMLQLAHQLLEQARSDTDKRIPVIFNLSSWVIEKKPFAQWLIDELKRNYGTGKKLAQEWINGNKLIYFLDGLDEVSENYRDECLNTINTFLSPTRQVVICSRIEEYQRLKVALNIHDKIELQPLKKAQVKNIFEQHIPDDATVTALLAMLQTDEVVWREVNKPLFINMLIATYSEGKIFNLTQSEGISKQKIPRHIIETYLNDRLQNGTNVNISPDLTWRYLAWLGKNLQRLEQTVFYVKMLQADWLLKEVDRWRWYNRLIVGGIVGGIFWLNYGVFVGVLVGASVGEFHASQRIRFNQGCFSPLLAGLNVALLGGGITGLVVASNDGIFSGLNIAFGIILLGSVSIGLLIWLSDLIKLLIFRVMLSNNKLAPRRYDHFLEHLVKCRIMYRVGGGVMFIHRYILEFYANEWDRHYTDEAVNR